MILHWLITACYLFLFLFILKKSRFLNDHSLPWRLLAAAFVIKVISGIVYGYFDASSGRHGGDSMNYFWDANWIFRAFHENPAAYFQMLTGIHDGSREIYTNYYQYLITWKVNDFDNFFNDSRTFVRLHAFIRLFSFGVYNVHVMVLAFLSFIGQLLLFKTFRPYLGGHGILLFVLLCFLPSSLVWYSAALKEPLLMLGLGLCVWNFYRIITCTCGNSHIAGLLASVLLLLAIRFYLLACLAPAILAWWWLAKKPAKPWLKAAGISAGLLGAILATEFTGGEYKISRLLYDQLMNSVKQVEYYEPGTKVEYTPMEPDLGDILAKSPGAFLKTLATPLTNSATNIYKLPFFAENIFLLLLACFVMFRFRKAGKQSDPLLFFSLFFVVILYILIGLTTPNEGTILRYRSVALPFILFILLSFYRARAPESEKKIPS